MQQFRSALAIHEGRLEDDKWHQDMSESKLMSLQFLLAIGINITRFWMILIYAIHPTINFRCMPHLMEQGITATFQQHKALCHHESLTKKPTLVHPRCISYMNNNLPRTCSLPHTLLSRRDPSSAQRRGSPPVRLFASLILHTSSGDDAWLLHDNVVPLACHRGL